MLKIFGIAGAQSVQPCLWCKATKLHIQNTPSAQPGSGTPKRSLTNLEWDHRPYKLHGIGSNKKKEKTYDNVVHSPLLDLQISQVTPTYVHILSGTVKRYDMFEQECCALDSKMADCTAEDTDTYTASDRNTLFVCRTSKRKKDYQQSK